MSLKIMGGLLWETMPPFHTTGPPLDSNVSVYPKTAYSRVGYMACEGSNSEDIKGGSSYGRKKDPCPS